VSLERKLEGERGKPFLQRSSKFLPKHHWKLSMSKERRRKDAKRRVAAKEGISPSPPSFPFLIAQQETRKRREYLCQHVKPVQR
jgi:hypothetical protein